MSKIIGRTPEIEILNESLDSIKSELITVYGRRRVGRTFLVWEFYNKNIVFEVTGLFGGNMKDQLQNFSKEVYKRTKKPVPSTSSW